MTRASVSGRMGVYYVQKIAKYVQNPEVDVRIRQNFEARRKRTSRIIVVAQQSQLSTPQFLIDYRSGLTTMSVSRAHSKLTK